MIGQPDLMGVAIAPGIIGPVHHGLTISNYILDRLIALGRTVRTATRVEAEYSIRKQKEVNPVEVCPPMCRTGSNNWPSISHQPA
jgi:hypothetical protein